MKKIPVLALTALITLTSTFPVLAASQDIKRIAGKTRVETSYETSKFINSHTYVFANAYNFPDALSAYNLVKKFDAKLVLIGNKVDDIKNLKINEINKNSKAYVVGGNNVLSATVEAELKNNFDSVERVSGKDRYATNLSTLRKSGFKEVGLANGQNFADALSASGYLNKHNLGLALVETNQKFNQSGITPKVTFGGQNSVKYGFGKRLYGENRYDTALAINEDIDPSVITIADGRNFPDALSALNLAIAKNAGVMLTNGGTYSGETKRFMDRFDEIYIVGGVKNPLDYSISKPEEKPVKPEPKPVLPANPENDVKPANNKNLLLIVENIVNGNDVSKSDIEKVSSNPVTKNLLEDMGYEVNADFLQLDSLVFPSEYSKEKSKKQHDLVLNIIKKAGVDSSMDRVELMKRLAIAVKFDESGENISNQFKYKSQMHSPYGFSEYGIGNCTGFSQLLSQILFELKIPSVNISGYTIKSDTIGHETVQIYVDGVLRQASLQTLNGFEGFGLNEYRTPSGKKWTSKDVLFINKPWEPTSYYINQIRGVEKLYNQQ